MVKRFILFVLIFLLASFNLISEDYIFRNTNWGMTTDQVMESESAILFTVEEGKYLIYEYEIFNKIVWIFYQFSDEDNELNGAGYIFKGDFRSDEDYFEHYYKMKEILINEYGEPFKEKIEVNDSLYDVKNQDDNIISFSSDEVFMLTAWVVDETSMVEITLSNVGSNPIVIVFYSDSIIVDEEFENVED